MENELIKIWQSSPNQEQIKFEKSRLILDTQSSLDRANKLIKYGILIEQSAVLIIIPIFSFLIYFVPFLLSKIASFLLVIWAIWYMRKLRSWKKSKPSNLSENYLEYLYQNQNYLRTLKKWGNTALYWYILPGILGTLLFIMGAIIEGALSNLKIAISLTITIGTGIGSYFYSKWATKKLYTNRLTKIEELIKVMEE